MRDLLPLILVGLLAVAGAGAATYWYINVSYGPMQETQGSVVAKRYTPSELMTTIDAKGHPTIHTIPAVYATEIRTELGGFEDSSSELYHSVVTGDRVTVRYRQRYWKGQADKLVFEGARR